MLLNNVKILYPLFYMTHLIGFEEQVLYKSIVFFNLFNIYFYHIKYAKNPLFMGFFLILPLRILFINVINCSLLI